MVLAVLRCSVVGKWTAGAVGAEAGKLGGTYKVLELFLNKIPIIPIVYPVSAACLVPGTVTH